ASPRHAWTRCARPCGGSRRQLPAKPPPGRCAQPRPARRSRSRARWSQTRLGMSRASCSAASTASSPEAAITSSVPPSAPRARTSRMLFAFARRPLADTNTSALKAAAARTSMPAGRAWSATVAGSWACRSTRSSELGDIPRLLGRAGGLLERAAGGRGDGGGDGALHERGVGDADSLAFRRRELRQRGADGQHRAAEVDEDDGPGSGSRGPEELEHAPAVRAEGAVLCASCGYDRYRRPRYLARHVGATLRNLCAVRYE